MKKLVTFISAILLIAALASLPLTSRVGAGEKANVLVSTSPGQVLAMGIKTGVTGTSTFTVNGIGTVTAVIPGLTVISDDVRYAMGTSTGANVTLKVYGIGAGTSTALSTTATNVEYIVIGTP